MATLEPLFITVKDAATVLDCHPDTLRDWLADPEFAAAVGAFRRTPTGGWRVSVHRLHEFAANPAACLPATTAESA
jgi:hypothetical protein